MQQSSPRRSPSSPTGCPAARNRSSTDSLASFVGHPAYNTDTLRADLHRFAFLPGASDGEELFGEPTQ